MRVCFVSSNKAWGGGEQLLAYLIEAIAQTGPEVALVARQDSPLASWGRRQMLAQVYEQSGRGRSPIAIWRLRRWLANQHFDLLVLNDPHAITSGGLAAQGLPMARVGIRHTVFPIRSAWKHNCLLDQIICVSAAAQAECVSAGIPREKMSIVYGGIPKPKAEPAAVAQIRQMFQSAAESAADCHLLAVGGLLPVKGLDTLIRALARGVRAGRQWRLWLAGEGPERLALEALAVELQVDDRVNFLGFRRDVAELLAAADLFVSASHSEGLSLVLVEAMLAGCPLAATAVGGSREVLRVDDSGRSPLAAIFEPGNVAQLVDALDDGLLQSSSHRRRIASAKQWAEENFSQDQMAEKHLAIYRQVLAAKPKGPMAKNRRSRAA